MWNFQNVFSLHKHCLIYLENPPVDKVLKKRKREENEEERARKFFTRSTDISVLNATGAGGEEDKSSSDDNKDDEGDEDEMPSEKFRRGKMLSNFYFKIDFLILFKTEVLSQF